MNYYSMPVARVFRGDVVESAHWGSAAAVDADGRLRYRVGDPHLVTFLRSSAKPFQAIPVVESGAARKFDFTSKELAIMTASHSGEDFHVEAVRSILDKIGLSPEHLKCGVHVPHRYEAMKTNPEPGSQFSPLEHNCSGKHAGMLALAVFKGLSVEDYLSPDHPVQRIITKTIADICRYPEEKILIAIDGCSVPAHAMPLYNMALGYARLISPNSVPKEQAKAYSAISMAMLEYPEMVGGTGRFDTVIAHTPGESLITKGGAEALECFAFVNRGMGAALKITDGGRRAIHSVAVELLYKMGARIRDKRLNGFHRPIITNWRGVEVGFIEPEFEIEEVDHE
jgi:L-asparaginase II